jgi:hypothetical protein
MTKYIVKDITRANGDVKVGDVVYDLHKADYGLANDDTRYTGIEHVSVTFNEDGDYPSFTIPLEDLEVCSPEPEEKPLFQVRLYMKSGRVIQLDNLISFNWKNNGTTKSVEWQHHAKDNTFNLMSGNSLSLDQIEAITHRKQKDFVQDFDN